MIITVIRHQKKRESVFTLENTKRDFCTLDIKKDLEVCALKLFNTKVKTENGSSKACCGKFLSVTYIVVNSFGMLGKPRTEKFEGKLNQASMSLSIDSIFNHSLENSMLTKSD